ncbi:hypothetical protein ACPCVO_49055 [Streptomyces umbrinus]
MPPADDVLQVLTAPLAPVEDAALNAGVPHSKLRPALEADGASS